MSFRLPQSLATDRDRGGSPLDAEILAEKAASLGRAGKRVGLCLDRLRSAGDAADRPDLVKKAAEAVHALIVQRELCGLVDQQAVLDDYQVPHDVIAMIGVR